MDTSRTVLTAQHVMKKAVYVIRSDTQVLDAVDFLVQRSISGVPVVDDGRLVGIFSERDALAAIAAAQYEDDPPGTVAQHMRRDFAVVGPTTDIYEIASVFRSNTMRRIPVVDASRRLLGLIARSDVLKAMRVAYQHRPKTNYERLQEHMALRHGNPR